MGPTSSDYPWPAFIATLIFLSTLWTSIKTHPNMNSLALRLEINFIPFYTPNSTSNWNTCFDEILHKSEVVPSTFQKLRCITDNVKEIHQVASTIQRQSQLFSHMRYPRILRYHILNLELIRTIPKSLPLWPSTEYIDNHAKRLVLPLNMNNPKEQLSELFPFTNYI